MEILKTFKCLFSKFELLIEEQIPAILTELVQKNILESFMSYKLHSGI